MRSNRGDVYDTTSDNLQLYVLPLTLMSLQDHIVLNDVLTHLSRSAMTFSTLLVTLIQANPLRCPEAPSAINDLSFNFAFVLQCFHSQPTFAPTTTQWVIQTAAAACTQEIFTLTKPSMGFHFAAQRATEEAVLGFDIQTHMAQIEASAPHTWKLFHQLFSAEPDGHTYTNRWRDMLRRKRKREAVEKGEIAGKGRMGPREVDVEMEDAGQARDDEDMMEFVGEGEVGLEDLGDEVIQRRKANIKMVRYPWALTALLSNTNIQPWCIRDRCGVYPS